VIRDIISRNRRDHAPCDGEIGVWDVLPGSNFVSGLICTLKTKNLKKTLKPKNFSPKSMFLSLA